MLYRILSYQRLLLHKVNQIMATLADVQAALTAQTTATDSLIANSDAMEAQITDLLAKVAAGTTVTAADLQAIVDGSNAETAKIAADLAKNKPVV